MSQYLNVFLRKKTGKFKGAVIPFGSYSRLTEIYDIFGEALYLPYESANILTEKDISDLIAETNSRIKELNKANEKDEQVSNWLKSSVTPQVYDKFVEQVTERAENISERKTEIDNYKNILGMLDTLDNIMFWFKDEVEIVYGVEIGPDDDGYFEGEKEETDEPAEESKDSDDEEFSFGVHTIPTEESEISLDEIPMNTNL